ncbi:MAG: hypothetical protein KGH49_03625 [Candidatus Micrarchaeota archaeon]|nr:hypothetical protein [Candidatus Micrarchaeota archaeon]
MADTIATISLRRKLVRIHTSRRMAKSMDYLKESVARLSKVTPQNVKLDKSVNNFMQMHSIGRMSRIEVKLVKDANSVKVSMLNQKAMAPAPAPAKVAAKEAKPAKKAEAKTEAKQEAKPAPKPKKETQKKEVETK